MRYTVFGIGRQGLAAVFDLIKNCQATDVLAVDVTFQDTRILQQVRSQLQQLLGADEQYIKYLDADLTADDGARELVAAVKGSDCVLSALPYALNARLTEIAIAAQVPMCDMGGNPDMVEQQQRFADTHQHIVVPECGLAPGIINILIKHLVESHEVVDIRAYCGGLPRAKPDPATNPLLYKLLFSPAGLISEYMGRCPVLRDGQLAYEPALTGLEIFDEDHEAFFTSNNSPRTIAYLASLGVANYAYKTLRYQGHLEKVGVLLSLGFLAGEGNSDPELQRRLADSATLRFDRQHDRDKSVLVVRGAAANASARSIELVDYMDEETGLTAMERTTSWGTTIVAHALACGISRPAGFATPEQFIDTEWFIGELRRRTSRLAIQ